MKNIIFKLGGSVITDKNTKEKAREGIIENIARVIGDQFSVIIHGGGSFGHHSAKEVGLNAGPVDFEKALKVMRSMDKLASIVYNIITSFDVQLLLLKPRSFVINRNLKPYKVFYDVLREYKKLNAKILTHGDVVTDIGPYRFSVCSGDHLALIFAKIFNPDAVVFLSDVSGIYTKNPKKYDDAKLIEEITGSELYGYFEGSLSTDVTGGMKLKVDIIRKISKICDVYVLNGFDFENLRRFLNGDDFVGTRVRKG